MAQRDQLLDWLGRGWPPAGSDAPREAGGPTALPTIVSYRTRPPTSRHEAGGLARLRTPLANIRDRLRELLKMWHRRARSTGNSPAVRRRGTLPVLRTPKDARSPDVRRPISAPCAAKRAAGAGSCPAQAVVAATGGDIRLTRCRRPPTVDPGLRPCAASWQIREEVEMSGSSEQSGADVPWAVTRTVASPATKLNTSQAQAYAAYLSRRRLWKSRPLPQVTAAAGANDTIAQPARAGAATDARFPRRDNCRDLSRDRIRGVPCSTPAALYAFRCLLMAKDSPRRCDCTRQEGQAMLSRLQSKKRPQRFCRPPKG
jgi:hypothetical protein